MSIANVKISNSNTNTQLGIGNIGIGNTGNNGNTSYFLPYQEAWINDDSPLKVAEKSRRVGFTYASSYRMFQKCMRRGKGFTQWVSSRDRLTAQELIRDYIAMWCKLANVAAQGLTGENVEVIDTEKDITAFVCSFPNGARIVSLSSTPEAFAGKGGDVFLDEVDLHRDSGALIDMAYPCIMWGNQLEMVSAYRVDGSKDTPFARLVAEAKKDNPQHASLHRVTIHDAVAQGLVEKINAKSGRHQTREEFLQQTRAGCRTLAAWESQFECKVQDAGGKLLPVKVLAPCEMDAADIADIERRFPDAPRFAGFDIARRRHASAWSEWLKVGVSYFLVCRETFHDMEFEAQRKFIEAKMSRFARRISRLAMDATGLGMETAEWAAKTWPGRVDGVNLESHRRHELCMMFQDWFLTGAAKIPADAALRDDFSTPYVKTNANGSLRVIVPEFDGGDGEVSHCDEFMAAVLARSAADAGGSEPAMQATAEIGDDPFDSDRGLSRRSFL